MSEEGPSSSNSVEQDSDAEVVDEEEVTSPLARSQAFVESAGGVGAKRARSHEWEQEDSSVEECPDLGEYFSGFELTAVSQIAMCRTYANYLAALSRPKRYTKRGTSKPQFSDK